MAKHIGGVAGLVLAIGHVQVQVAEPVPPSAQQTYDNVPTLGEVRAIAPDEEAPVDLYRFKNPVTVEPNRFDRDYRPPPSVKQVSEGGGYLMMGLYYGVAMAAKGIHRLTGGPDQIQSTIARPPPLTEAQLQRAASMCGTDGGSCVLDEGGN
jgi:hypothetical protein